MRTTFYLTYVLAATAALTACSGLPSATSSSSCPGQTQLAPLDYADSANWMRLETHPKHRVDMLFFYPTIPMGNYRETFVDVKEARHQKGVKYVFNTQASVFEPYTNVFVPYYRQARGDEVFEGRDADAFVAFLKSSRVKTDIYAALDQYFAKHNQGRPFILAGHSQGTAVIRFVLDDYMKQHPDYLKRMVAAYALGFPFTKDWLKKNPHVKFAQGETDTGVLVSWNTEAPGAKMRSILAEKDGIAINPLNWKLDDTLAPVSLNKGTLDCQTGKIVKGVGDARLDLKRNVVICSTAPYKTVAGPNSKMFDVMGDQSLHVYDYPLYYMNIRENGLKRINAYLAKQ